MSPRRVRSAITMAVMAVLVLGGAAWGWSALTSPLPEAGIGGAGDEEICVDRQVPAGSRLGRGGVTVSVLNAGDQSGAAARTLNRLVDAGFAEGTGDDAPEEAEVVRVQIWTDDRANPAVRLVASWLGEDIRIEERETDVPGVVVVVGDEFGALADGRNGVRVRNEATVCGPANAG